MNNERVTYDILPHTIFLTIGPSGCGKTYFCKNHLIPKLEQLSPIKNREKVSINYISSDDIRRVLLGNDLGRNHDGMMAVSKMAFEMLYKHVDAASSFPVNSEFIIVDTKGTNENFRKEILDIAEKNHYNVVALLFNYKKFEEYHLHVPFSRLMQKDVTKMREISASSLKKNKVVRQCIQIKENNFEKSFPELSFSMHEKLQECFVNNEQEALVISDVHGCYDEFVELLDKSDIKVENHKIVENKHNKLLIVNGDYIDKGPKIFDMIEFCYQNSDSIKITVGNHENRLYKELTQGLEHISEPWFNTFDIITDEYKEKFIKVFENTLPFVMNDKFIATHSPCNAMYLGKIDSRSCARQRYFMQQDMRESLQEEFDEQMNLFDRDIGNIYHIFGHVQTSTPGIHINNRILIDGACVIGGRLVSAEVGRDRKLYIKSVASHQNKEDELFVIKPYRKSEDVNEEVNIDDMTDSEKARLNHMLNDKVNFISGTMSPCDKMNDKLESIESAIEYFKSHNVFKVCMQPKYMGSRCNMYLFENNDDCYCVSRNGYKIKIENLEPIYEKMRDRLKQYKNDFFDKVRLVILDGELMPWSALGQGLINDFKLVYDNVSKENEFLKETNFEKHYNELLNKMKESTFLEDKNSMSKKELIAKIGDSNYSSFNTIYEYHGHIDEDKKQELADSYNEQLHIYGSKGEIDYKPFAVLKIVMKDDKEVCYYLDKTFDMTNEKMFNILNEDQCNLYDLTKESDINDCIEKFKYYTEQKKFEGIVMKPNDLHVKHVVPYMKVRNPNYLSIVYGYDYQNPFKSNKLYERKSIKKKLDMSWKEWHCGLKMLAIHYNDISESNNAMKRLFAKFIMDEKRAESFDPRL